MDGTEVRSVAFHRSLVRSDARLTYGEVDELFAGATRAEEPWAEPLAAAREVARRAARAARRRSGGRLAASRPFEFDDDGHVTGVRHEQQTESHRVIEQLMILANEQVAGYLADQQAAHPLPRARAARPAVGRVPGRAAREPRRPDAAAARADEPAAGGRRGRRDLAASWRARSRGGRGATRSSLVLRSLKQAYYSPRNLGHAGLGERALLPLHLADPALPGHRRAPRAAPGARRRRRRRRRRTSSTRPAWSARPREREAMEIERDADDVCLAFLLERVLSEVGPDEPARSRARWSA